MNKAKLFINNFLVYGLGGIISKLIPFLMLPILTRLYPSSEYMGLNDLVISVSSMGSSLAVLGINNAMFRLFFEEDSIEYKEKVCSSALAIVTITSLAVAAVSFFGRTKIISVFFGADEYSILAFIAIFCMVNDATKNISSTPTRMENKRHIFLVINTVSPIAAYTLAFFMIKKGMYIIGLPLAMLISAFIENIIFILLNRKWFSAKKIDYNTIINLFKLALPLAPNFLVYWVFNFCDKVIIKNILGAAAVGIYSVGAKMGHVSQLIYIAFSSGWQYFAFHTMKEENQVKNNSIVFDYLNIVTLIATMFVCLITKWVFNVLFTEEYQQGQYVMPYLFMAPLLMMLFQVISNQFLVIKKTWPNAVILACGAISNIILNIKLIPLKGVEGAAIATLVGYIISIIVCVIVLIKMHLLFISKRIIYSWICFAVFFVFWRVFYNSQSGVVLCLIVYSIYVGLYWKELRFLGKALGEKGMRLWKRLQS